MFAAHKVQRFNCSSMFIELRYVPHALLSRFQRHDDTFVLELQYWYITSSIEWSAVPSRMPSAAHSETTNNINSINSISIVLTAIALRGGIILRWSSLPGNLCRAGSATSWHNHFSPLLRKNLKLDTRKRYTRHSTETGACRIPGTIVVLRKK